jgi:hypothetical protein
MRKRLRKKLAKKERVEWETLRRPNWKIPMRFFRVHVDGLRGDANVQFVKAETLADGPAAEEVLGRPIPAAPSPR